MMYQAKILGAAFMIFSLFGCGKQPEDKLAIIKGQAYLIPWQDKPKVTPVSWLEGELHVRIPIKKLSEGQNIALEYDPRAYSTKAKLNIPSLFGLNGDSEAELRERLDEFPADGFSVFCLKRYEPGVGSPKDRWYATSNRDESKYPNDQYL